MSKGVLFSVMFQILLALAVFAADANTPYAEFKKEYQKQLQKKVSIDYEDVLLEKVLEVVLTDLSGIKISIYSESMDRIAVKVSKADVTVAELLDGFVKEHDLKFKKDKIWKVYSGKYMIFENPVTGERRKLETTNKELAGDNIDHHPKQKPKGKIRFIRLKYKGLDWYNNYGKEDHLILTELYKRTKIPVSSRTEFKTIYELTRFKENRKPPFMYLTGAGSLDLSEREKRILGKYLLQEHGMLIVDSGGRLFEKEFKELMSEILSNINPEPVSMTDELYRCYYFIQGDGNARVFDAVGWRLNKRWVVYFSRNNLVDMLNGVDGDQKEAKKELSAKLWVNAIYYAVIHYIDGIKQKKEEKPVKDIPKNPDPGSLDVTEGN